MRFYSRSNYLLKHTKARAKLSEFNVPYNNEVWRKLAHSEDLIYSTIRILSEYAKLYVKGNYDKNLVEIYKQLDNVAKFYEYYIEAENTQEDYFFYLTGICANYLSDNFGNAKALFDKIGYNVVTENNVSHLLINYFGIIFDGKRKLKKENEEIEKLFFIPFVQEMNTNNKELLKERIDRLVDETLSLNLPETSFFSNMLRAVHKKSIENSATRIVPLKTSSDFNIWKPYFDKQNSIKVLWQAQKLIVENGILDGKNATIQLPTGVGKTKSAELIILAAVLLRNIKITIVVSPLKSLCNEISQDLSKSLSGIVKIREVSDVIQNDFGVETIDNIIFDINEKQVIILTPEKLYYIIRHNDLLIQNCGLIIFDEAHLFDDLSRGLTYELLVVKTKELLPKKSQKIFISAVMPNANEINNWLNDGEGVVVSNNDIKKTEKSVGFYSAIHNSLNFYESNQIDNVLQDSTFIPNIINNRFELSLYKVGKKKDQPKDIFPDENNKTHIALFLALLTCANGNVALYFNSPKNIFSLAKLISELSFKGYQFQEYIDQNSEETIKIVNLIHAHYGNTDIVNAAKIGIFPHYGDLENGLRLSIEAAMKNGEIKIIACTSTLAEGVNLPIRYLLMTTFLDTKNDVIKTRKFQNLFGRTARSGKFTEGSLVCTDSRTFDGRYNLKSQTGHNWKKVKELFNTENSEVCISVLNELYKDVKLTYDDRSIDGIEIIKLLIENYSKDIDFLKTGNRIIETIKDKNPDLKSFLVQWENRIIDRISVFNNVIQALESYMLHEIDNEVIESSISYNWEARAIDLFDKSLAKIFTEENEAKILKILFIKIYKKALSVDYTKRRYYKKSLLGIKKLSEIDALIEKNNKQLIHEFNEDFWVNLSIYLLKDVNHYERNQLMLVLISWLKGETYAKITEIMPNDKKDIRKIEKFCRNSIGYYLSFTINAVTELLTQYDLSDELLNQILIFQKRIKYGLPNNESVVAYELGFSDRIIAQEVGTYLAKKFGDNLNKIEINQIDFTDEINTILSKYPSYFRKLIEKNKY